MTRPVRDPAMDFYRVIAILFVVLGHWLVAALTCRNGQFDRQVPLVELPLTQCVTWAFQVVPISFVVAGHVHRRAVDPVVTPPRVRGKRGFDTG